MSLHPNPHKQLTARVTKAAGFTLIEVMITVAIVGILATIAVPSYNEYIRRGQLPEAFTNLSDYRVKLEQYYQDHRNYGTAVCADGAPVPAWSNFAPAGAQRFTFQCVLSNGGQGYTLTAIGSSGQATGHEYTLTAENAKATTKFKGQAVNKTCWASKAGDC